MSNHGITLLFTPGPHGRPEVLYLRDIEVHCPACGMEQMQRYYSHTPWHTLTVPRLRAMLESAPEVFASECTQCGETLRGQHAVRWMMHYGFPGLRGLVQGFADRDGWRQWLLAPWRRMDGQLVPEWEPLEDQANVETPTLDEAACQRAFGRPVSCKEAARRILRGRNGGDSGWMEQLAEGLLLVAAASAAEACEIARAYSPEGDWVAEPLVQGGQVRGGYFGAPSGWLGDMSFVGQCDVFGVADASEVATWVNHVLRSWPIEVTLIVQDGPEWLLQIPSTSDASRWPRIAPRDMASEAARTLVPVPEAVHLELDRVVQFLSGMLGDEWSDAVGDSDA